MRDDSVPALDGDDDAAIARWAEAHRRSVGRRLVAGAVAIAAPAVWWIRHGLAEQGDPVLIWAPSLVALAIAAAVAAAGVIKMTTPVPARSPSDW
jgi:hypothetical protein